MKKSFIIVISAIAVVLLGGGGIYWFVNKHQPLQTYYTISLHDKKANVLYEMGVPDEVTAPVKTGPMAGAFYVYDVNGDPTTDKSALPVGQNFQDFDEWMYNNAQSAGGYVSVGFLKPDGVGEVKCFSDSELRGSCNPVLGINIGDSEEKIRSVLGKPSAEALDGVSKDLLYSHLNVLFLLQKQKVYMIEVGHFKLRS